MPSLLPSGFLLLLTEELSLKQSAMVEWIRTVHRARCWTSTDKKTRKTQCVHKSVGYLSGETVSMERCGLKPDGGWRVLRKGTLSIDNSLRNHEQ